MKKLIKTGHSAFKFHLFWGIFCIAFTVAVQCQANAPSANSRFTLLSSDDGLATGAVKAVYQDSVGYMWFGGQDGLARFDGYEYEHFTHRAGDAQSISHNDISDIIEDTQQRLWVATDSGLDLFDRDKNSFTNYALPDSEEVLVRNMVVDQRGLMWLGTPNGLVKFNPDTKVFTPIGLRDPNTQESIKNLVLHLTIDHQGMIWASTDGAGLFRYNPQTETFFRYTHDKEDPESIAHNVVWMVKQLRDGKIWVATDVDLSVLEPVTGKFTHYRYIKDDPTSIAGPTVTYLMEDDDGYLWVGTNLGLCVLDINSNKFSRILHDPNDPNSISSNIIRIIYQDNNQDVWVGTFPDGVNFFNRGDMPFNTYRHRPEDPYGINATAVLSFLEDSQGRFWVGTDGGGANLFDPKRDTPVYYEPDESRVFDPELISGNAILDLAEDSQGNIWMGHWGRGISRLNPESGAITHYKLDHQAPFALRSGNVWVLFFDRDETLWVGTIGGGLYRYNPAQDNFMLYQHNPNDPTTSGSMIIWTIMQDSHGMLWIGTDDGLDQLDPHTDTFKHFRHDEKNPQSLGHNVVLSIHEASDGTMWIGTRGGGLNKLNKTTESFTRFDKQRDFPSNVINAIEEDQQGNLWLGSNKGLIRFNPKSENIRTYNKSNGIQGDNFNINTSITLRNGELVFGGTKGYTVFDPRKITDNDYLPHIVMRELKILNETVHIDTENSPLTKSINRTEYLELNYDQYVVTFKFAGLSYRNPEKNQYAYRLDPFDKKWNNVGTQRTATYTNLDAGEYHLRIKAANNEGLWNETAKIIAIRVLPPPWLTWWAYTLYGLILFAIIAGAIEYQRRKRQFAEKLNVILEEKVSQRTEELRNKNYDIQIMLNNIRQGLITVQPDGRIYHEYSRFVETIFETDQIANQYYDDLLFRHAELSQNDKDQITEAVKAIINEDVMNFEFNHHLLCDTIEVEINHQHKILDLDWSAITEQDDDTVTKIMISIRDVTALRQAESEREQQKRELIIIGQLINISDTKFKAYCKSVDKLIHKNETLIQSNNPLTHETLTSLFRNMHTIKGNSRTYGFDFLSDAAHQAEDLYSRLSATKEPRDTPQIQLAQDLSNLRQTLKEYQTVFQRVFERGNTDTANPQQNASFTLKTTLENITQSLPSIALELGKNAPLVEFLSDDIEISEQTAELINQVFTHILRNSIDHGIETAEVRIAAGKPAHGKISLRWQRENEHLQIYVKDDGQGLDIGRLYQKGLTLGMWTPSDNPTRQNIAELVFSSGVSTKEQVTEISGRGVGMDAAKAYIEEQRGAIAIQLLQNTQEKYTNTPFEFFIQLPHEPQ
ncbi:Chemotaxis protein CheA [Thalassocella blandensis]|nr:Chemotaxis protein CheA [Thalassocella blandensis]